MNARRVAAAIAFLTLCPPSAEARDYRHQRIELGAARAQRNLWFYSELPGSRREAERLPLQRLPCGTPLTPLAYQSNGDGPDALAFLSFSAPHASGHILLEGPDRQKVNLLDYFLFDPQGTPFCLASLEQTLTSCGAVGVRIGISPALVLEAELENLSSNQVLFVDWLGTQLISGQRSAAVIPSDVFLDALEARLQGPLASLSPLGLGTHAGLKGFATDTAEADLVALWDLSRRVTVDLSGVLYEPLGPGQKRAAPLSVLHEGGWRTAGVLSPSSRGSRHTLSIPIARVALTGSEAEQRDAGNLILPRGPLSAGTLQVAAPRLPTTEPCTIGFTIR
jgi:hypothetical protein